MVERHLPKVNVVGSSPIIRFRADITLWWEWLLDRLTFPFQVERQEDLRENPFAPNQDKPFSVGHEMKVISIEDEDETRPSTFLLKEPFSLNVIRSLSWG